MQQLIKLLQTVAVFCCFIETCSTRPDGSGLERKAVTVMVDTTVTLTIAPSEVTVTSTITSKSTHTSTIISGLETPYTAPVTDDASAVIEVSGDGWGVVSTIQELSWKSVTDKTSLYLGIANSAVCDWNADSEMMTCEGTTFASRLSTSDYVSAAATSTKPSTQPSTVTVSVITGFMTSHDAASLASSLNENQSGTTSSIPTAKASTVPASSGISDVGLAGAISGSSIFVLVAIPLGFFIIKRRRKRRDTLSAPYLEQTTERTDEEADADNTIRQEIELPGQCSHVDTEKMPSDCTFPNHISPIGGPELEARHCQPYAELDNTIARHELHDHEHTEFSTERPQYEIDTRQNMRPSEKELWFHT